MRRTAAFVLALTFASVGLAPTTKIHASPAESPDINGSWKLVIIPGSEIDFAIFDVKATDGKIAASVIAAYPALGPVKSAEGTIDGDKVAISIPGPGEPTTFKGVFDKEGKKAKGGIKFRGTFYPGRLERTAAKSLAPMQPPAIAQKLNALGSIKDPKEQMAKLRQLIDDDPDSPINSMLYTQVVAQGEAAGLSAEEVVKLVAKWIDDSKAYGPEWTSQTKATALRALLGKKPYAALATEMALAADKAVPADAPLEAKSLAANMLATSAKLAGKADIAAEAEGRAKGYDSKLDEEYQAKVPPFKPETVAARAAGKADRVMLMEIFTGAECPPCVAADVAFDALLKTYKPTEFIGLQHHLHIPGPDPLTNADTIARAGYYGKEVRGTPSTFFNGKSAAGGGGGMGNSQGKYQQFRSEIDPALAKEKQADIKLTATLAGDEVKINASAKVDGASKDAKPKLRLVLVEEAIRYPGGNKLRFHHNVVRAFPGGVEGKPLEKGEGTVDVTVKLSDLRKAQEAYVEQFPTNGGRPFAHPLPPIDLDDLAVVAFIQDDADHAIWHAVQTEVKSAHP